MVSKPSSSESKSSALNLRQGKLSFVSSKRTATAKAAQKPKATQSKPPSIVQISAATDPNDETITEDKAREDVVPRSIRPPSKRENTGSKPRIVSASSGKEISTDDESKEIALREELDVKDLKWREYHAIVREKMGHLAPIHAKDQNEIHEILRVFDMSFEYGPCIGITRLERWERASALGLNPPKEVQEILTTRQGNEEPTYAQSVLEGEV